MEPGSESSYTGQVSKLKKTMRRILIALVVIVILFVGFISWSFYAAIYKWQSPGMVTVEIEEGTPVSSIAEQLAQNQVIKTPRVFTAFVRIRGLAGKFKAGEYEFPAEITADKVISMLVKGEVKKYQLQIIEGWTIKDIANYLSQIAFLKDPNIPADFLRLTFDKAYIESLGFKDLSSLEGYLFPDTYEVLRPKSADEIIKRLVSRFREVYTPECTALADRLGLSQNQTVTMASIIEKETGKADERPIVASVYYNRLKQNMALQADPTVIYGISNFNGNLTREDLENGANPYNTYMHLGLPPGPICNPGKASIDAALQPADTKYLYFVSKNDGSHVFSETLEEHQRNVAQYQLGRAFAPAQAETGTPGEVEPPPGVTAIPPLVAPQQGAVMPPPAAAPAAPGAPPALPALPAPPPAAPSAAPYVAPAAPAPQAMPGPSVAPAVQAAPSAPTPSAQAPAAPAAPVLPKVIPATPPEPAPTTPSAPAPTTTAPAAPAATTPSTPAPSPTPSPAPAPTLPPPTPTPVVPPPAAPPAAAPAQPLPSPTPPAAAPAQ